MANTLRTKIDTITESVETVWTNNAPDIEQVIENLEFILSCVRRGEIKYGKPDEVGASKHQTDGSDFIRPSLPAKKRVRGRPRKTQSVDQRSTTDSPPSSLNDSVSSSSSTSSNRPRRAAAQAADEKLVQVQNLMKATKLRRPSDFDEKQNKQLDTSVPPSKSRRTDRKHSTGNSSQDENADMQVEEEYVFEKHSVKTCTVKIEQLQKITSDEPHLKHKSRSLERISAKRKTEDLFMDCPPEVKVTRKTNIENISVAKENQNGDKILSGMKQTENVYGGESTSEVEINQLKNIENKPSSLPRVSLENYEEFKGFDCQQTSNLPLLENPSFKEETCNADLKIIETKEESLVLIRKTFDKTEIKRHTMKSKTKVLRKLDEQTESELSSQDEKENLINSNSSSVCSRTCVIKTAEDMKNSIESGPDSPTAKSRTKVLRKGNDKTESELSSQDEKENVINSDSPSIRSRTKVIKKADDNKNTDIEVPGTVNNLKTFPALRSESELDISPEQKPRSRTKTLKKKTEDNVAENNSQNLGAESTAIITNLQSKNILGMTKSPAPAKGELVRKRVENFEKMKNHGELVEEDTGRVTRNAAKNKTMSSSSEILGMKRNANIIPSSNKVMAVKKQNMTPSSHPKGIPSSASRVVNKGLMSANHQLHGEDHTPPSVVEKQIAVDIEKKRKEEERLKRQAKEEEAKKKKERKLEAKAEETRRKREEKLKKVAATREAAEKEKVQLALKQEQEREEKLRLIAIEKEKQQKEDQMKKKMIAQQKAIELEERRKQDEAARLAKLREQEEEHRRALAIKEREQEMLKQQKVEQLRLAEAEKAKHQGGKLAKLAAANNAKIKLQNGTSAQSSTQAYEITPAREERPLKKPKTENDYGIDDATCDDSSEDESQPKKIIPKWAQAKNRGLMLKVNHLNPKQLWGLFMECNPKPDIEEIFKGNVPIKKRVRTSSAVWRTPPRF